MFKDDRHVDDQEWRHEAPYKNDKADFQAKYTAHCHCGQVEYSIDEEPLAAQVCHCTTCQVRFHSTLHHLFRINRFCCG